jgi:hypothetical protein
MAWFCSGRSNDEVGEMLLPLGCDPDDVIVTAMEMARVLMRETAHHEAPS